MNTQIVDETAPADASGRATPDSSALESPALTWTEANHRYLLAAVDVVRAALENHATRVATDGGDGLPDRSAEAAAAFDIAVATMPGRPALERLVSIFGLSPFERFLLLLGIALETDASFALLCAAAHNDDRRDYPTFRLALDVFPDPHWDALAPEGALRRWRMVELGSGLALASRSLSLAERVVHELLGVDQLDERLAGLVEPMKTGTGKGHARHGSHDPLAGLAPSHRALAGRLARVWQGVESASEFPAIQVTGSSLTDRRALAAAVCGLLGRGLMAMNASVLPTQPDELELLRRTWELEGALGNRVLLIEFDHLAADDRIRAEAAAWMAESVLGGVLLSTDQRQSGRLRPLVTVEVGAPTRAEQWGCIFRSKPATHSDSFRPSFRSLSASPPRP